MDWVALGELLTLLAIGLLTPGPNALTCFGHSGLFGPRANIKLIAGMAIGFVTIELSVGLLVDAVSDSTAAMNVLHWIGMVFLGAMVVAMFRFDPASVKVENNIEGMLGLKVGIGMQFVNGKAWIHFLAIMATWGSLFGTGVLSKLALVVLNAFAGYPAVSLAFIESVNLWISRSPRLCFHGLNGWLKRNLNHQNIC